MKIFFSFLLITSFTLIHSSAEAATCAFGRDLDELFKNKRFIQKSEFETFKLSREKNPANLLLWVRVTPLFDTKTKREYHLNRTVEDAYDGGNTVGWIEDITDYRDGVDGDNPSRLVSTGSAVADISDGSVRCRVNVQ